MSVKSNPKIALIGNPNSGKSSLFNQLTGLSQKVGNFPGVTVEKRTGSCQLDEFITAKIIDLPGTYSIYARSTEEKVAVDILGHPQHEYFPDILVFIADASNLKRNLLLFTQVKDLGVPVVLALNMMDLAEQAGIKINIEKLREELRVQVVPVNARSGEGLDELKYILANPVKKLSQPLYDVNPLSTKAIAEVKEKFNIQNTYQAYQLLQQGEFSSILNKEEKESLEQLKIKSRFKGADLQAKETINRYRLIHQLLGISTSQKQTGFQLLFGKIDRWLTHPVLGYGFFIGLLFILFQLVFALGNYPMHQLDSSFSWLTEQLHALLPEGAFNNLLTRAILPALGGVFVFIPHLLLFYIFVALLEESGYMSRVILLMDKFMRFFGLTGRSAVPLLSNAACGSPAILACLDCSSWRQKLNRIFITPLVNCSNRLPVYIILIALFIPFETYGGIVNLQGLVLLGMYFLSFLAAILSSLVLKVLVKSQEEDYLMMELPYFTTPYWKDIWKIVRTRLYGFSLQAVRTVIPVSMLFWGLLNFGPAAQEEESALLVTSELAAAVDFEPGTKSKKTYAAQLGNFIEPAVRPLGFDWQIGLAVISSFVAREVFVGSLATIYSQDESYPTHSIVQRVEAQQKRAASEGAFTLATVLSLLVFYAFAMQFFNLLGRVMKDGRRWWAPLLQMVYMTGLAYISAYSVFQLFS